MTLLKKGSSLRVPCHTGSAPKPYVPVGTRPVCCASGQASQVSGPPPGLEGHTKVDWPKSVMGTLKNSLYSSPVYSEKTAMSRMQ